MIPSWKRLLTLGIEQVEATVELDTGERLKVKCFVYDWADWKRQVVRDVQRYIKQWRAEFNPKELVGKTFHVDDWKLESLKKT
jgi:hypothetical protein